MDESERRELEVVRDRMEATRRVAYSMRDRVLAGDVGFLTDEQKHDLLKIIEMQWMFTRQALRRLNRLLDV